MAETTTATSWPAPTSRLTWRATLRMRSISATDVPPNFITSRAIAGFGAPCVACGAGAAGRPRAGPQRRAYITAGCRGCNRRRPVWLRAQRVNGVPSMASDRSPAGAPTVDDDEVARFAALAGGGWDPRGKMAPLHKFNPVRLGYIRDAACRRFVRDARRLDCLAGLRVLDIGPGGGIPSEPPPP